MNPQCPGCNAERTMLMDGTEVYRCGSEYNRGTIVHACYKPQPQAHQPQSSFSMELARTNRMA